MIKMKNIKINVFINKTIILSKVNYYQFYCSLPSLTLCFIYLRFLTAKELIAIGISLLLKSVKVIDERVVPWLFLLLLMSAPIDLVDSILFV
jgi:hypothetical protein